MGKEHRGFASMDKARQREIASKGGKAAHAQGTAHEWDTTEAKAAGRRSHVRRGFTVHLPSGSGGRTPDEAA